MDAMVDLDPSATGTVGDLQIPTAADIEDAENVELLEESTIDGTVVDVWQFDLSETMELQAGELTLSIDQATGRSLLAEGWYEVGHVDNPMTIDFEQRTPSFDEDLGIEMPDACADA